MRRILLTGADGFVGRCLASVLAKSGDVVVAVSRCDRSKNLPYVRNVHISDIRSVTWGPMLEGIDAVIHLAARAHVVRERSVNPLTLCRAINVQPTIDLFRASQIASVKSFVFVSSIGVNGNVTAGKPFTETDSATPREPYAISKWEAEQALRAQFIEGSTSLIIVRPTLIYGANAKGNFLRMLHWIDSGWPLPFGALTAKRSFLGLTSFCDLLDRCLAITRGDHLFVAADSRPLSTKELIDILALAMGVIRRQWPISPKMLSIAAKSIGRGADIQRLMSSLEVDSSLAMSKLGWKSAFDSSLDLQEMVDTYRGAKSGIP